MRFRGYFRLRFEVERLLCAENSLRSAEVSLCGAEVSLCGSENTLLGAEVSLCGSENTLLGSEVSLRSAETTGMWKRCVALPHLSRKVKNFCSCGFFLAVLF